MNALQHAATCCNTLQQIVVSRDIDEARNVLQRNALHYNMLQHAATRCNTLQHAATDRSPM